MKIKCVISLPVTYRDKKDGKNKTIALVPGERNYPMLDSSDPMVAEQLRVYRKHHRISFNELLPSDVEIMKDIPDGEDKVKVLAQKVMLQPSPVGRKVNGKAKQKKESNARRSRPDDKATKGTRTDGDRDPQSGGVSNKE